MENNIIGVDIGGSHITSAVIDIEKRKIIASTITRQKVNSEASAQKIISCWSEVILTSKKLAGFEINKIGIAIPGPFDYINGISFIQEQNKYDSLYKLNIKQMLAQHLLLDSENLIFANDAACFLLGESKFGAGKNFNRLIGITLGTGLGSAYNDGKEIMEKGLWNSKFKDGIAEDYLSSQWFINKYASLSGHTISGVKELCERKDKYVSQIFQIFAGNLAVFLQNFLAGNPAEIVIIGGNIAKAFDFFGPLTVERLSDINVEVKIKKAELGEEAALIGAALQWMKKTCP